MENLDRFDICLDLSSVETVYDYVSCREYTRPEGGWDYGVFRNRASLECLEDTDENNQLRVDLMDKAFTDKRLLEKKNKEDKNEKTTDLWSQYSDDNDGKNLPRRVIPMYKPGDVIKGNIVLSLNKPFKAEKLVAGLRGRAFVKVRCYNGKTCYDVTGEEEYVREKKSVWERADSKKDQMEDELNLLSVGGIARSAELTESTHTFPFEFAIPTSVPQSAPPMVISSYNRGYLVYRIKAAIDKDNVGGRGNIVIHKGIWVKKDVDIAADSSNREPVESEETLETGKLSFWKSGSVNVRASLKTKGCIRGDPVPIRIEINNQSEGDIKNVSARIRMFGRARVRDSRVSASNKIDIKSTKMNEGPIGAGMCPVYNFNLPWDFLESSADGNLLPVGDLNDSTLLDINYEVVIKLKRSGAHRDMELNIPIYVGTVNSRPQID